MFNVILSALKEGCSGNNMSSLLIEMGLPATTVFRQQMKQEIELLVCKQVKEETQISVSGDKHQFFKDMALQISNLLEISEFHPLLGCILDNWGNIPEEKLDADILKICDKILDYEGNVENKDILELKMKTWKLHLVSFEKGVLDLVEKCTLILPLPTILSSVMKLSELVKACSNYDQLFHVAYQILYNLVITSNFSQLMVDIITIFTSTIRQFKIDNKLLIFYPNVSSELQSLSALLSCNPKGMTEHCLNKHITTIMKNINQLADNGITYHNVKYQQDFHWLMFDKREWYYSALWQLLICDKKHLPDLIGVILWYERLHFDQNLKEKIIEFVNTVRVFMIRRSLQKEDLEYAVGGFGSISSHKHFINYMLFLFILQSEIGVTRINDIINMNECEGVENSLFMIMHIEQVHNINFTEWSINKRSAFKDFIIKSMRELEQKSETLSASDETNLFCQKYKMFHKSVENMLIRIK